MLRQEGEALASPLDRIVDEVSGGPVEQLKAWIETMYVLARDPDLRMHLTVIDSDEVRAATGYREARERLHADRERSLSAFSATGATMARFRWRSRRETPSSSARSCQGN